MHIPTTALLAISFYMLGRSSAERAEQEDTHDGFGLTNHGIMCHNRFYAKAIIYATANHSCVTNAGQSKLRNRNFQTAGHRIKYPIGTVGDDKGFLSSKSIIVPIRQNLVFPFELDQYSRSMQISSGELVKIYTGKDRLVLGDDCLVLGIFSDLDFPFEAETPNIKWCTVIEKYSDIERYSETSSERYLEISPGTSFRSLETSLGGSRQRSRVRSANGSQRGSRDPYQERFS